MKKKIATLVLTICLYCTSNAQVVYEATYYGDTSISNLIGKIKINQTTTKYLTVSYSKGGSSSPSHYYYYNITYKLYSLNHSLYKTLPIPDTLLNPKPISIQENLFNTNANIEIAYFQDKKYMPNQNPTLCRFKVIDETGAVIFTRDTASAAFVTAEFQTIQSDGFFNTENGAKLILNVYKPWGGKKEIYSLGGTVLSAAKPNDNSDEDVISISPNPSKNYTRITYKLPENENTGEIVLFDLSGHEIKRFVVDNMFNDLLISTDDLPAGTYIYSFYADGRLIDTKKSIVIK